MKRRDIVVHYTARTKGEAKAAYKAFKDFGAGWVDISMAGSDTEWHVLATFTLEELDGTKA